MFRIFVLQRLTKRHFTPPFCNLSNDPCIDTSSAKLLDYTAAAEKFIVNNYMIYAKYRHGRPTTNSLLHYN